MTNVLVSIWTGPCYVSQMAVLARLAGFKVEVEGTEHIYVWMAKGSDWGIVEACIALDEAVGFKLSKGAYILREA